MSKYIYIEWPVSRGLISARVLPPSPIGETAVQRPSQVENYSRQGVFDVDTHLVHHFWQVIIRFLSQQYSWVDRNLEKLYITFKILSNKQHSPISTPIANNLKILHFEYMLFYDKSTVL
jgi:hypothetical protein